MTGRRFALAVLAALGSAVAQAAVEPAPSERLELSSDLALVVKDGRDIVLVVTPTEGEDFADISRRVCGTHDGGDALEAWNRGVRPETGQEVYVPLPLLSDDYRVLVLGGLFPRDRVEGDEFVHHARSGRLPTYNEGLWQVAQWYTGDGGRFVDLQRANGLSTPELAAGQTIRIPLALLHPAFHPRPRSDGAELEYGRDAQGPYAGYRLKPGEALYSAVVVRFTGRDSAEDVRDLARYLAERSGVRDVRDIPAGFQIKIPFEYLEPQFLPANHPRRREAEANRAAMERELAQQPIERTRGGLAGVVVVLDPGHGGKDLGTMNNGIWEHDYVYDVTCRLKERLERETAAKVVMTLIDAETGCVPSAGDKLVANQQGTIQTTPPFLAKENGEAKKGVNLRWYLANSIYRSEVKNGASADRVIFLSIHADSRDRSLRGMMAYVPGAKYRRGTYVHNSKDYRRYKEVREAPKVQFSYKNRIRSEAVSRKLAEAVLESFGRHDLPIQKVQPVRDRVIRGKHIWLPAVIRANQIPAKLLIELVNMSNKRDAGLLASAKQRQKMADALFEAVFDYFGEKPDRR